MKRLNLFSIAALLILSCATSFNSSIRSVKAGELTYDYKNETDAKYVKFLKDLDKNEDGVITATELDENSSLESLYYPNGNYAIKLAKHMPINKTKSLALFKANVESGALMNLPNLEALNVSHSQGIKLSDLGALSKLKTASFSACKIVASDTRVDEEFDNLKTIWFTKCHFDTEKVDYLKSAKKVAIVSCIFKKNKKDSYDVLAYNFKNATTMIIAPKKDGGTKLINNPKLKDLSIYGCKKIKKCPNISNVSIFIRKNETADLSQFSKLKKFKSLEIRACKGKQVDLSKVKNITSLKISEVDFKNLDKLKKLKKLEVSTSDKNINFSANKKLKYLYYEGDGKINISNNRKLQTLILERCTKYSDLRKNKKLKNLTIEAEKFPTYLNNLKIKNVTLTSNKVKSVVIDNMKKVENLTIRLQDADFEVKNCKNLKVLKLYYWSKNYYKNTSTAIKVKNNPKLIRLVGIYNDDCAFAKGNVFVTSNKKLKEIQLGSFQVNKIDLSKNSKNLVLTYRNLAGTKGGKYAKVENIHDEDY